MMWSAEIAVLDMWREMDLNQKTGAVQAFFKKHLQAAYDRGLRDGEHSKASIVSSIMHGPTCPCVNCT